MRTYRIVVLPGDGIGPEVMRETLKVVKRALPASGGPRVDFSEHPLGAGLVGGLGLGPSAEIGERFALFQPSHGSAPQITGLKMANPLAMILSAAMMLDWLGEGNGDDDASMAGRRIEMAVAETLRAGKVLTPDLGGKATTAQMGNAILKVIESGSDGSDQ